MNKLLAGALVPLAVFAAAVQTPARAQSLAGAVVYPSNTCPASAIYTAAGNRALVMNQLGQLCTNASGGGGGGGAGGLITKRLVSTTRTRPNNATPVAATPALPAAICDTASVTDCTALTAVASATTTAYGKLVGLNLYKSTTTVTGATFKAWAFTGAPVLTGIFDETAYQPTLAVKTGATYIGEWDCASMGATTGAGLKYFCTAGSAQYFTLVDGSIYLVLGYTGSYTPGANETFNAELEVEVSAQ